MLCWALRLARLAGTHFRRRGWGRQGSRYTRISWTYPERDSELSSSSLNSSRSSSSLRHHTDQLGHTKAEGEGGGGGKACAAQL